MVSKYAILRYYAMTVLLEYIDHFHKCINIAINLVYIFPIMLALCLMLLLINYAQNYAGIIDDSLHVTT